MSSGTSERRRGEYRPSSGRLVLLKCLIVLCTISSVCQSFQTRSAVRTFRQKSSLSLVETETETRNVARTIITPFPISPDQGFTGSFLACAQDAKDESSISREERADNNNIDPDEDVRGYEDDEARERRVANAAKAAALLARRGGHRSQNVAAGKTTSVGSRRVGSASRARGQAGSITKLADAIRKGAGANTVKTEQGETSDGDSTGTSASLRLSNSVIHTAVENMLQSSTSSSIGLFGTPETEVQSAEQRHPAPGTVLIKSENSMKPWRAADRVSVRVATISDDMDIANLRLSVFSDFSPEMRRSLCARSCEVLSNRRKQGATCIVATVPRYGSILSSRSDIILGTAECSFHEFKGTSLGQQRLSDSILYITEVAVSPTARRKGIGMKMMGALDQLASSRTVETLFLHVDVTNKVALTLYQNAGYSVLPKDDPKYAEFTMSLNLHDGATKGRNHYLMSKDVRDPTWLRATQMERGTLGIEVAV